MAKRILTSGDLTADRRADYAAMLADSGDAVAAADLMGQALDMVPDWGAGWFQQAGYLEKAGDTAGAMAAYRQVLALVPDDIFGAGLKLSRLDPTVPPPKTPPSAYVEGLFDDYADRFDQSLVEKLHYTVPEKLAALILRQKDDSDVFTLAVDLGCGTGLFGAAFAGQARSLEGYDLSEAMLGKARGKNLYQHLGRADLSLAPEASGLFAGAGRHRADLVAAADVMMYLGDLRAAFANARALLSDRGLFAFSVEKSSAAAGFELRDSLRYAHSEAHVASVLDEQGMQAIACEETVIRMDGGQPITGLLFLATAKK